MNHPFELEPENYPHVKKLFADILFWQTFENLNLRLGNEPNENQASASSSSKRKEEIKSPLNVQEEEDDDYFEEKLE